jgi:hypothetical protein
VTIIDDIVDEPMGSSKDIRGRITVEIILQDPLDTALVDGHLKRIASRDVDIRNELGAFDSCSACI